MIELNPDQIDQIVIEDLQGVMQRYELKDTPEDNYLFTAVSTVLAYYMPKTEYNEFLETLKGKQ